MLNMTGMNVLLEEVKDEVKEEKLASGLFVPGTVSKANDFVKFDSETGIISFEDKDNMHDPFFTTNVVFGPERHGSLSHAPPPVPEDCRKDSPREVLSPQFWPNIVKRSLEIRAYRYRG